MGWVARRRRVSLVVGGRDSVWRRGPTAGSRTVALSTPVRVPVFHRAPGQPRPDPRGWWEAGWWLKTARPSRSRNPRSSWRGSPRSTWPGVGDGVHAGAAPGQAGPACHQGVAAARPPPPPSSSWPSSWPAKGSNVSWSSPPPTTGGPGCTCCKPAAWWCGWSTPATPEHLPGRPKTDKLDAVWLARLNERGMLRPSFVPPAEIRRLRDYTRLRSDLTAERGRHVQRLEKLLEDALIKLGTVATDIMGVSGRAMLEALIAGQRDPKVLAELARGRMRGKRGALVQALHGRFDDHHAELARMLLDHYDALTGQIDRLTVRIQELIGAIPAAQAPSDGAGPTGGGDGGTTGVGAHPPVAQPPLGALDRLDEVPGVGVKAAQMIIAEVGLDMGQFPTPGHLVSWARLSPRTIQSGAKQRAGATGKGNPYLKGVLGEVAAAAAKTDTFLGQRYRRLVRRIGKL